MKTSILLFIGFSALLLYSNCSPEPAASHEAEEVVLSETQLAMGARLLQQSCFTCHSPRESMENRAAPPMGAVKRHYLEDAPDRAAFIVAIRSFVQEPHEDKSKMPGALKRFGLMPQMSFTDEQINAVAAVLYDTEIEAPDWFEAHYQEAHDKMGSTTVSPLERGRNHAMAVKAVLGKNLMQAIKQKGTSGALLFCNKQAYPLTDSMANKLNVFIKRVSDKNRNPKNAANEAELAYIQQAKASLAAGEMPKGHVQEIEGGYLGYYPILSDGRCLQCHGKRGEEIKAATQQALAELYPADKATGYSAGELRGIWVVEMPKK